jgi:aerobic carbon-monoxide dehydrogenase small subunit
MLRQRILDTKDEQVGTAALACSAGLKAGVGQFVLSLLWRSAHDTRHRQQAALLGMPGIRVWDGQGLQTAPDRSQVRQAGAPGGIPFGTDCTSAMRKELIELRINLRSRAIAIEPSKLLLDTLRQDLQLTGSKRGCDDSSCGACTVLVDGIPMLSCALLAASCEGQEITTVEGVSEHGALAAIQKAYGDWGGAQCGFCTPGFMMTVKHLLAESPNPTEDEIRSALSGNLCRCTGYTQMYQAIKAAIEAEKRGP